MPPGEPFARRWLAETTEEWLARQDGSVREAA
jgi:hypothetical protein